MVSYQYIYASLPLTIQCPKLRVHPAPGVHISAAGCTIFGGVHPECARFFGFYHHCILGGCMEKIPVAQFLGEMHPVGAQDKTLISDTAISNN